MQSSSNIVNVKDALINLNKLLQKESDTYHSGKTKPQIDQVTHTLYVLQLLLEDGENKQNLMAFSIAYFDAETILKRSVVKSCFRTHGSVDKTQTQSNQILANNYITQICKGMSNDLGSFCSDN